MSEGWAKHFQSKWARVGSGPSRGLGDTVHKLATVTGIKAVVEKISGGPCAGCGKRREALNTAMPYSVRRDDP